MKYMDRKGNATDTDSGQDRLLNRLYTHFAGRVLVKMLSHAVVSKAGGWFLNTKLSSLFISPFVKRNQIPMSQYQTQDFASYNDFFTRKIKNCNRPVIWKEDILVSPCDGKMSVYPIHSDSHFYIKNTYYTVDSLLRSQKLAAFFREGTACVFRLTVDDYHRYCYMDDGIKSRNYRIPGVLHTVNPIANDVYPIYKENTREYCLLKSKQFGTMLIMEVGALMVGKINNYHQESIVKKGQEKGRFEFGGSTIIVLLQKNRALLDPDLFRNTEKGYETIVKMGEQIGKLP